MATRTISGSVPRAIARFQGPGGVFASSSSRSSSASLPRWMMIPSSRAASSRASRIPVITSSPSRHRPTLLGQHQPATAQVLANAPSNNRSIFIQTETTPNADGRVDGGDYILKTLDANISIKALKFIPNHPVLPEDFPSPFLEYLSPRSTLSAPHPSPLAARLLNVDGVSSVFYGPDFITITKAGDANWAHIKPEVFSLITEAVTSGEQLVSSVAVAAEKEEGGGGAAAATETAPEYDEADEEVVGMINELLETRIRPAIQEDGGDIEFRGFKDGTVMLKLRGACRTCDSSTVTLKNGIESMLMHYIEEVKSVTQVLDEEEEVAMKEFERFEEKLRHQKGPGATASTTGKGSLDTAEA
ncbi:hypothetical protein LOZ57_005201 [Ophidiomyces ophidiicola]|uniref:uncharacterized protein n=1 Tax=Ophidiomyces ophidiicola TaxID=1387563 RepID=UPI0020C3953F|nr:uncharacterized protein LOZ57_005201 [Ophidiomyces ophidiicola]KAI1942904.1 hypothetical protein LOZ57_005201 [Ophidiomyces ophidiicola]KAI2042965.1 hypothetical protein LOZ43_006710 [Ophidiomyces ophidiicola]